MQAPLRPFLIVDGAGREGVSPLYRYGGGVQIFPAIFDHAGAFGFARFKVKLETERQVKEDPGTRLCPSSIRIRWLPPSERSFPGLQKRPAE